MMYHAAAVSYYTVISLLPLFTLLLSLSTILHEEFVARMVTDFTGAYLLPAGEQEVLDLLLSIAEVGHHTVIGFVLTSWGALRMFTGLKRSFARIYDPEPKGMLHHVRAGVLTLLTVGFAIVAVTGLIAVVGVIDHPGSAFGPIALAAILTAVFFPIYYFLPGIDLSPRDVLPGTIFAAAGWTVLSTGFTLYVEFTTASSTSIIGSFLLLLTWFYLAGLLLLFGGVVNAVLLNQA